MCVVSLAWMGEYLGFGWVGTDGLGWILVSRNRRAGWMDGWMALVPWVSLPCVHVGERKREGSVCSVCAKGTD